MVFAVKHFGLESLVCKVLAASWSQQLSIRTTRFCTVSLGVCFSKLFYSLDLVALGFLLRFTSACVVIISVELGWLGGVCLVSIQSCCISRAKKDLNMISMQNPNPTPQWLKCLQARQKHIKLL